MNWDDRERLGEIADLIGDALFQLQNFVDETDATELQSAHTEVESAWTDIQNFIQNSDWGPTEVQS